MNDKLHCIIKKEPDYWAARCLDFTLYAVGDSKEEAIAKLESQINEYLYDALEGEDKEFAAELLLRKAPLRDWVLYHILDFIQHCIRLHGTLGQVFKPTIPHLPHHA